MPVHLLPSKQARLAEGGKDCLVEHQRGSGLNLEQSWHGICYAKIAMSTQTQTSTIHEINTTPLFWKADWKLNGDLITAIHGRDESTEALFASSPEGSVMISTRKKNQSGNGFVNASEPQMVSPDTIVTD
jgi:hypothetical protein